MATHPDPRTGGRDAVLAAVAALYHAPDGGTRSAAGAWLEAWQGGAAAWSDADALLHDGGAPMEARYLAAQTLRTKVARDFEELPGSAVPALRDSLASLATAAAARGEPPVRTQLCLALAALAAHAPAADWPGGGPVPWAAATFGEGGARACPALLIELLTLLPEEAASYRPALPPARRRALAAEADAAAPAALALLEACLASAAGPGARAHALEAFAAWLRLGSGGGSAAAGLAGSPLVRAALAGLADVDAFPAAVDAAAELVARCTDGGAPAPEAAPLAAAVVPAVLALHPRFAVAAARAGGDAAAAAASRAAADYDDDDDAAAGMARLFAEVGEAYVEAIADAIGGAPPLDAAAAAAAAAAPAALLDVAAHPDDRVASMSFTFWHRLARCASAGVAPQPLGDEGASPRRGHAGGAALAAAAAPLYERLVRTVAARAAWPPGARAWRKDERADFRRARGAVADVLEDAASVLGPSATLALLAAPLADAAAAGREGRPVDWAAAEGALFCVKAAARAAAPPLGDPLLLSLLASLPSLPSGDATLTATAAGVAGACADWLAAAADGGDARAAAAERALLEWLAHCLTSTPSVAGAAAAALAALAAAARGRAGQYAAPLAALFARAAADPAPTLPENDLHALGEAAMAAACAVADPAARAAAVGAVFAPVEAALSRGDAAPAAALTHADRAAALLRRTRDPAAAAAALTRLWPALEAGLAATAAGDDAAVERWCRVARHGLKAAGRAAAPLLPALADKLPRWFAGTRASAFLYVASELVKTFGGDVSAAPAVAALLAATLAAAAAALPDAAAVDAAPDVADDAFLLGGRALAYAPAVALAPPAADGVAALVGAATAGALVQHREACTSLLHFLERLCSPDTLAAAGPAGAAAAAAAVHPRGGRLVARLLAGALGALPPPRVRDIADALHALLRAARGAGVEWVAAALAALPDAAAPAAERARVLAAATAVANATGGGTADSLDEALDDLSETVRRSAAARRAALAALVPDAPPRVLA